MIAALARVLQLDIVLITSSGQPAPRRVQFNATKLHKNARYRRDGIIMQLYPNNQTTIPGDQIELGSIAAVPQSNRGGRSPWEMDPASPLRNTCALNVSLACQLVSMNQSVVGSVQ